MLPGPRRRQNNRQVSFGSGSSQTVYVIGEDGNPKAIQVVVGASDGSRTVITGGELKAGMKVIKFSKAEAARWAKTSNDALWANFKKAMSAADYAEVRKLMDYK